MALYGYARVSTADQSVDIQVAALKAAGCDIVRTEQASGTSTAGRPELATLLTFLRPGDTLVVTRIDRLARSVLDLATIVEDLKRRGIGLRATEQPIDTSTPAGNAFLGMLSVFAQFETEIRRERQMEGVRKAKAEGRYKGRPVTVDEARIRALLGSGMRPSEVCRELGVGRSTVWRAGKGGIEEDDDRGGCHAAWRLGPVRKQ